MGTGLANSQGWSIRYNGDQMIRLLVAFLACAGVALCAADFSGSWKGDVPRNGRRDDFSLTLIQDGQQVSGLFAFDRELRSAVSIERPELRNDELTFEIHDMDGQLVRFRIRPVADKLAGDVTVGSEVKRIEIAPAVYRVGRDVTAPVLINKVEPRPAKVQGAVDLAVEISPD